jgi:putative cardiolipin synthase
MRRLLVVVATLLLAGCASLPSGYDRVESRALPDTASTPLGQTGRAMLEPHPGQSGFRPLPTGVEAMVARMMLADAATRSLDVQYYIWHDDLTGRLFADALLRAADRGVRVRVLVDDVGTKANDSNLLALDSHPNIEIRLFNPVASRAFRGLGMLTDFTRVNRRMHNKSFIADNQRAVLGGRNVGDEYFDASGDVAFSDLDVLMLGPVVGEVSNAFDTFWNSPVSVPIGVLTGRTSTATGLDVLRRDLAAFVQAQRDGAYVTYARSEAARALAAGTDGMYWGQARLLVDDPEKVNRPPEGTEGDLLPQLRGAGIQVQHEMLIVSPYFVPGDAGVAALAAMVKRGVRVTVLTNSLAASDVGAVHAGYERYRQPMVEAGVRLFEMKPAAIDRARAKAKAKDSRLGSSRASLHAKTYLFDRRAVFIGSLNLDPRSVQLNTEIGVVCESGLLAGTMARQLESVLDQVAWRVERVVQSDGKPHLVWIETTASGVVQHTAEPEVSIWRRFSVWFLGLLPIESQL